MDHVADSALVELSRFAKLYTLPAFVKQAAPDSVNPKADDAATIFADPANRRFPCHSAAATWLSALYFTEKSASLSSREAAVIRLRLDKSAAYWGITPFVTQIRERHLALTKNADADRPDSDYALVWADERGVKQRFCRMVNPVEVKTAACWLQQHRDAIPFPDRHTIASKVLEKAAAYGADLGGELDAFIQKQAGRGVGLPDQVVAAIRDRATLCKTADDKAALIKLADKLADKPRAILDPNLMYKVAELLDRVDRNLRLLDSYGSRIRRPEDVLFTTPIGEIKAARDNAVPLVTGRVYDKSAFEKVTLGDIQSLFGSDMVREVGDGLKIDINKLAEQAAAMPRPDAELLERLLDQAGVPPLTRKQAEDAGQQRNALAATY